MGTEKRGTKPLPRGSPRAVRIPAPRVAGLLPLIICLLAVALVTRADYLLYLLYSLLGIYLLGRLWAKAALSSVVVLRRHDQRAFLEQTLPVEVEVRNRGWLPVLWLRLNDSLPAELALGQRFAHVLSLAPREGITLHYALSSRRRGYYRFGALAAQAGDLLGMAAYESRFAEGDYVIVYPRIIPLPGLSLPSHSPLGTLPSRERIFEDPARVQGVRDYQTGDSLRAMDWKTSARIGRLQVRRLEPSIALETELFVNLNGNDYSGSDRYQGAELGIVIAASLAVHIASQRQAVGLVTNGRDPLRDEQGTGRREQELPPRKGQDHLMHVLDLLARIEVESPEGAEPFFELLGRRSLRLPWGSTVVVITGRETDGLMDTLLVLRRRGLEVSLVLTCPDRDFALTAARTKQIGVRAARICSERELEAWR